MNLEIISLSVKLDSLIQVKLNAFQGISESSLCTIAELKSEINNLRYLIYIINQDRMVRKIQNLRQVLSSHLSLNISQVKKEVPEKLNSPDSSLPLAQYDLYNITDNSSEICTVVNTSILPVSYEPTDLEFSPFSVSPLFSPRTLNKDDRASAVFLTTEATVGKAKQSQETKYLGNIQSEVPELSPSKASDLNISIFTLNASSYIPQPLGDDMDYYSCPGSMRYTPETPLSPS